jgi:transposase
VCKVVHGHYKNFTLIAALRHNRLCADGVLDGALNSEKLLAYAREKLLPELRRGDMVIWDNLPAHKSAAVKKLLAAHGCRVMFLPPYSPDLNPIEMCNAKLKSDLRGAAAREHGQLVKAVAKSVRSFTPRQCQNYFSHAKYASI